MAGRLNRIGLEPIIYKGSRTTLCAGCGHNAISERIIDALYEMGIDPQQVVKLSGIGCSSKSPAYFLGGSHGFNAVHGRMPSVGTGAMLANGKLIAIGISGDGDTGAIGIGQFVHLMRRNLPIIYIIEDNGCYGLTKGQFSPTADLGSKLKNGATADVRGVVIVLGDLRAMLDVHPEKLDSLLSLAQGQMAREEHVKEFQERNYVGPSGKVRQDVADVLLSSFQMRADGPVLGGLEAQRPVVVPVPGALHGRLHSDGVGAWVEVLAGLR